MNPRVSIIVPVYKVEKYLENCVESVLEQTYTNWELILVDDGSPDKCPQLCDAYAQKDDRISVIHKKNGGQASARNQGIKVAQGEYITFLDGDDFLSGEYLSKLILYAEQYHADIVQCSYIRGGGTKFPNISTKVRIENYNNHSIFISGNSNVILCCKLFRSGLVKGIPIVEGKYFEDDWTTWKYYYYASIIVVSNERLYYYTCNSSSTMSMHSNRIPDISWIEPDLERISFFQQTGEVDLVECSRLQLCKVLFRLLCNHEMPKEQVSDFYDRFRACWLEIYDSQVVSLKYRLVLGGFYYFPKIVKYAAKFVK